VIPQAIGLVLAGPSGGCLNGNVGRCFTDTVTLPDKAVNGITSQAGSAVTGVVGDMAGSAWDSICTSFADAFTTVLQWFGTQFAHMPDPDLGSIHGVYAISLTLGMIIALVLMVMQAGSVLWTRSGAPLAQALTGLAKATIASLLTLAVATQMMAASDEVAAWIVTSSGKSMDQFSQRLTVLLALTSVSGAEVPSVLLLLFGLLGIVVIIVLWFELVLRNAVFAVIVATAPIAAAGQIGASTQEWWRKLVKAGIQLALLKPTVALVFVLGFDMTGTANGITGLISGMAVLFMAVFAWPTIGRFFTFTSASVGGAMGMGALVGAVANRSAGGGPGIDPAVFGRFSERQAMSANAGRANAGSSGGAGSPAGGSTSGAAGALSSGAGPGAIAAAALQTLHKTVNAMASRMEQQAGHGGFEGANPIAYPAGYPAYGPIRMPQGSRSSGSSGSSAPAPTSGKE
jgi:hypothetical protein